MKATLFGRIHNPAIAVVGSFDPFVREHRQLIDQLSQCGQSRSVTSLAVILHPRPAVFLSGAKNIPIYSDIATRIMIIRACGVDAVLLIRFNEHDLNLGAQDLFELVAQYVRLEEFWLGFRQSLGVGPEGSQATILRLAERQHTRIKCLPESAAREQSRLARKALAAGYILEANHLVGLPPIWKRPKSGKIRLPWPPGDYIVVPLDDPLASTHASAIPVRLETVSNEFATFKWPDRSVDWLAFVKGPGDK
jgi:FAD synthase